MHGEKANMQTALVRNFRKRWKGIKAHAIDEISVVPPQMLRHVDRRAALAMQRPCEPFGGLPTLASGDFLQLPPVEEP